MRIIFGNVEIMKGVSFDLFSLCIFAFGFKSLHFRLYQTSYLQMVTTQILMMMNLFLTKSVKKREFLSKKLFY